MDELGSYPRMHHNTNTYSQDVDQNGSWFGLAISGLKFLINNTNNNSINHNLSIPQSNHPPTSNNTSSITKPSQKQKKLHILGPSVFRNKLYDIPEYQTTSNCSKSLKTRRRLTSKALQQFNGNFSNYWNQRSSLHSHPSDPDEISNAGSIQTNHTNPLDAGSYTVNEHHPSMTSSQIIHPTQEKQFKLRRSHSYPLLHSAEYIHNFEQFSRDIMIPNDEEGIPSPPAISTTPEVYGNGMLLPNVNTVHALKSSDSINSSNFTAIGSESDISDGIVYNDRSQIINNHFIREQQLSLQRQKQWIRQNVNAMRHNVARKSQDLVHVHHGSKSGSDTDWINNNATLEVITSPLPKSMKKKKKLKKYKNDNEEEGVFSDWSNVSSNVGVTVPKIK